MMATVIEYSLLELIPSFPNTVREVSSPFLGVSRDKARSFRIQKCKFKGMLVLISINLVDKEFWMHVSYSYADKLPDWSATKFIKNIFIGEEKAAYTILPKKSEYVNHMPYCLHLWHCLSKPDYLPDFRILGTI